MSSFDTQIHIEETVEYKTAQLIDEINKADTETIEALRTYLDCLKYAKGHFNEI